MKRLFLTDKQAIAELLARHLGIARKTSTYWLTQQGDAVTWVTSQLMSLANPEDYNPDWKTWSVDYLPMLPQKFTWKPTGVRAKKRLQEIQVLIDELKPESIVNACDASREGELLFRLAWAELTVEATTQMERVWLQELTPQGITDALAHIELATKYKGLAVSAAVRAIADWTVGLNATRAINHALHKSRENVLDKPEIVSSGRLQTPILALLADYDANRRQFTPQTIWTLTADCHCQKGTFPVVLRNRSLSETQLNNIKAKCEEGSGVITEQCALQPNAPFHLFDLLTLQRFVNATLGWSAIHTVTVALRLYEVWKAITYPKTESSWLPEKDKNKAQHVLDSLAQQGFAHYTKHAQLVQDCQHSSLVFDHSKTSEHFAIIPTGNLPPITDKDANILFRIIARRFIAAFCQAEQVLIREQTITIAGNTFVAQQEVSIKAGWRAVYGRHDGDYQGTALSAKPGEQVSITNLNIETYSTQSPVPITEEMMLKIMDSSLDQAALGYSAKFASIIEKLKSNGFLEPEETGWRVTDKGNNLIEELRISNIGEILHLPGTAGLEHQLLEMEQGQGTPVDLHQIVRKDTTEIVSKLLAS